MASAESASSSCDRSRDGEISSETIGCSDGGNTSVAHFWSCFNTLAEQLQLPPTAVGSDSDQLEAASEQLRQLHLMVGNWSDRLPAFELMRAQQRATSLQHSLRARQQAAAPRKRFGFRNRSAVALPDTGDDHQRLSSGVQSAKTGGDDHSADVVDGDVSATAISDRDGERVVLSAGDLTDRHLSLNSLSGCRVGVVGAGGAATVHVTHARNCLLLLGSVQQSVMLDECHHCHLAVSCQQLRVHASSHCQLYVEVSSGPVLENCTDIVVAPFPLCLTPVDRRGASPASTNRWSEVQDFNWLSRTQPSPHWRIMSLHDDSAEVVWADFIGSV